MTEKFFTIATRATFGSIQICSNNPVKSLQFVMQIDFKLLQLDEIELFLCHTKESSFKTGLLILKGIGSSQEI